MRRHVLFTACLAVTLAATACQDQQQPNDLTAPSLKTAERQQPGFSRGAELRKLPARIMVSDMMDPSRAVVPTTCDDNTVLVNWFLDRAFEIPLPTLILLINRFADLVPTYEALLFQTRDNDTFFGYNGEYDHRMDKTERDVKRFWDIKSDDIQVLAMHGTVLADPSRTVPTYRSPVFLGLDAAKRMVAAVHLQRLRHLGAGDRHPRQDRDG
jgi:hypothetical protein